MVHPSEEQEKGLSSPEQTCKLALPTPIQTGVEEAIQQLEATIHGIEPRKTSADAVLGPTPTSKVLLDQVPVQALFDTGSPITIVSLSYFLQAASKTRTIDQSPSQWGQAVRERLQLSTVTLRSYGGDKLAIVSQVRCELCRGSHVVEAVLQVQEGAPVDLLIGTDVLTRLEFGLVRQEGEGHATKLLKDATNEVDGPPAMVKLLHATRLPAHHSRLVRVDVPESQEMGKTRLFEPEVGALEQKGLSMADAVVGISEVGRATLVISNPGTAPVCLEEGQVLGQLHPVILMEDPGTKEATAPAAREKEPDPQVAIIRRENQEGRRSELLAALACGDAELSSGELEELWNW